MSMHRQLAQMMRSAAAPPGGDTNWLHLWRMIDAVGTTAPDSVSSMDLTLNGGAIIDSGGDGVDIGANAARMETTCDHCDIDLMYPTTNVYTIFVSYYSRSDGSETAYGYPISVGDDPVRPLNGYISTSTQMRWDYSTSANNRADMTMPNLNDGVDVQLDFVLVKSADGAANVVYGFVNGVYDGEVMADYVATPFGVAASPFILGNLQAYNRGLDGIFHWAGIYNSALSLPEATAIVEAGRPAAP